MRSVWKVGITAAVAALAGAAWLGWRWLQRPMFEPGTAARRVQEAGESLAPLARPAPGGAVWAVAPGIGLHHFAVGAGPDVLVVHGGPGAAPERPWAAADQAGQRWHFFHQRGCGRSSRPIQRLAGGSTYRDGKALEARLGLAEQVADLERIRQILGREKLILVAHSFGALPAALYASEFRDRVSALVLVAPAPLFVMPVEGPDLFTRVRQVLPPAQRPEYDAYLRGYFDFPAHLRSSEPELSAFFGRFRGFFRAATGVGAVAPSSSEPGGFFTLASYLSLGRRHDWRPALARIRAPVLVIHGARDLIPAAQTRAVADAIPGARWRQIDGAGHFPFEEAPAAFAAEVNHFLEAGAETAAVAR
jgi:proline iminopeptidase